VQGAVTVVGEFLRQPTGLDFVLGPDVAADVPQDGGGMIFVGPTVRELEQVA
jgi:hypothetical protein